MPLDDSHTNIRTTLQNWIPIIQGMSVYFWTLGWPTYPPFSKNQHSDIGQKSFLSSQEIFLALLNPQKGFFFLQI